jgi:hypothetical protein
MEGIRILLGGLIFILLIFAVSLADTRLFSERSEGVSEVYWPETAGINYGGYLTETLEATYDESEEGSEVSAEVSTDVEANISASTQADFSVSGETSIIENNGVASETEDQNQQEPPASPQTDASITIDGEEISCPEGSRTEWENENTEVNCRNRNGDIKFQIESSQGGSIKIRFRYP